MAAAPDLGVFPFSHNVAMLDLAEDELPDCSSFRVVTQTLVRGKCPNQVDIHVHRSLKLFMPKNRKEGLRRKWQVLYAGF